MKSDSFLEISQLSYSYGDRKAVCDVSLRIKAGTVFGLLGPNGAGKSTLISCLSGLRRDYSGEFKILGEPFWPSDSDKDRLTIGVVPQELALYDKLSAEENLRLFGRLYGLRGKDLADRLEHQLDVAGLADRRRDPVSSFSGGMKRRLNLAAGLIHQPPFVLLDEPTVGVDPQSRSHLFDCLEQLRSDGKTLLYTTHYMEEAERLCDEIAIMNEGSILAIGSADQLRNEIGDEEASLETVFLTLTGRSLRD
ncbi:MAG: ABC transporter ATP-binding protein [Planctomycetota bacterium]